MNFGCLVSNVFFKLNKILLCYMGGIDNALGTLMYRSAFFSYSITTTLGLDLPFAEV